MKFDAWNEQGHVQYDLDDLTIQQCLDMGFEVNSSIIGLKIKQVCGENQQLLFELSFVYSLGFATFCDNHNWTAARAFVQTKYSLGEIDETKRDLLLGILPE